MTYADDGAIVLTFESWPRALEALPDATRGVEAAYRRWGFDFNWGEGKTELMAIFTGRGSKGAEKAMRTPDGRGRETSFERGHSTSQRLRIVDPLRTCGVHGPGLGGHGFQHRGPRESGEGPRLAGQATPLRGVLAWQADLTPPQPRSFEASPRHGGDAGAAPHPDEEAPG